MCMRPLAVVAAGAVVLALAPIGLLSTAVVGVGAVAASMPCGTISPAPRESAEPDGSSPSLSPVATPCADGVTVIGGVRPRIDGPGIAATDSRTAIAVQSALAAVARGGRYVAEGNGPVDFDCSGLTAWAWRQARVSLADYSYTQRAQTMDIPRSAVAPGDLVFWFGGSEHHVAIIVAVNGSTISIAEAANPAAGLRVRTLGGSWDEAYLTGFGRVVR